MTDGATATPYFGLLVSQVPVLWVERQAEDNTRLERFITKEW